jgi:hypothetical protein
LEVTQIYVENLRVILEADKDFCDAGVGNRKECNAAQSIMGEDWLDATNATTLSRTILNNLGPVHLKIPEIKDGLGAQGMSRFVQVGISCGEEQTSRVQREEFVTSEVEETNHLPTYLPTTRPYGFRFEEMHQIRLSLTMSASLSKCRQYRNRFIDGVLSGLTRPRPPAPCSSGTGNAIR